MNYAARIEGYKRWRAANPHFNGMLGKKYSRESVRKRASTLRKTIRKKNPRYRRKEGHAPNQFWTIKTRHGRMPEHRVIMQQILGRKLEPGERVWHKNRNRLDNRPENLELFHQREVPLFANGVNDKWSRKFDQCIRCHTRKYRHVSRGLCGSCNMEKRRAKKAIDSFFLGKKKSLRRIWRFVTASGFIGGLQSRSKKRDEVESRHSSSRQKK